METIDSNKNKKARKDHTCDFCLGVIKKDELYNWQKLVSVDHGIYEWKSHKHCIEVASYYDLFDNGEDGLTQMSFSDAICDIYSDKYNDDKNLYNQVLALYMDINNVD